MERIRSALFVPANRPERIPKALASGADVVIVDFEDAVAIDAKDSARQALGEFAKANPEARFFVRINSAQTKWFEQDLTFCYAHANVAAIMLPKAEYAADIASVAAGGKPVYPIIESALGIANLAQIVSAPGVARLSFGALDLGLDLAMDDDSEGATFLLKQVRAQIAIHSRAAGIAAPLDGVFPDIKNAQGLTASVKFVKGMGFAGAMCIHPSQVEVIHAALAPQEEELAWARRVVDMAEETGSAAFSLDGKMVDMPVIEKAKQILAYAA